ncbi:MAG: polysaccharide biosynthesis protein, partial [Methylobacter sp.]
GRKYYPVDYDVKRVIGYIGLGIGLYFIQEQLRIYTDRKPWLSASELLLVYILVIALFEYRKNTLQVRH